VERQTVSGWCTWEVVAAVNQVWNWVRGEGDREERSRVPLRYWEGPRPPGATVQEVSLPGGGAEWWGEGGCTDEFVCGGC